MLRLLCCSLIRLARGCSPTTSPSWHFLWTRLKPDGSITHPQMYRCGVAVQRGRVTRSAGECSSAAQSDFKDSWMLKDVWEFRGHCLQHYSLAAPSPTDNCIFLLLKAKVSLLSEYIALKAPLLPLDNLRSVRKCWEEQSEWKEWDREKRNRRKQ